LPRKLVVNHLTAHEMRHN